MQTRLRLCFVGLKCLDQLMRSPVPRYLGGTERQFVALAEALSARGHEVTFITYDHGQGVLTTDRGIRVLPSFSPTAGLPLIRFLFPKVSGLRRAIRESGVDIVLQMGAGAETGASAVGCYSFRRPNKRFVFCSASDSDCLRDTPLIPKKRESLFYKFGLRRADGIVVQTDTQQSLLRREFGRAADVVTMPGGTIAKLPASTDSEADSRQRVIWIGRISKVKRLEYLLETAEMLPDVLFDVVGDSNTTSDYASQLKARADKQANVFVHGKVDEQELARLYNSAALLCCTSIMEGFPTTFLEAWSLGKPLVTTFDPNGIVAGNELGLVADVPAQIAQGIQTMLADSEKSESIGRRCRKYFEANHSADAAAEKFEEIIRRIDDPKNGYLGSQRKLSLL